MLGDFLPFACPCKQQTISLVGIGLFEGFQSPYQIEGVIFLMVPHWFGLVFCGSLLVWHIAGHWVLLAADLGGGGNHEPLLVSVVLLPGFSLDGTW